MGMKHWKTSLTTGVGLMIPRPEHSSLPKHPRDEVASCMGPGGCLVRTVPPGKGLTVSVVLDVSLRAEQARARMG